MSKAVTKIYKSGNGQVINIKKSILEESNLTLSTITNASFLKKAISPSKIVGDDSLTTAGRIMKKKSTGESLLDENYREAIQFP